MNPMSLSTYNRVVGSTAEEFLDAGLDQGLLFPFQILKQNLMYDLPANAGPTLDGLGESPTARMTGFLKTLKKEMDEGLEILALFKLRNRVSVSGNGPRELFCNAIFTALTEEGVEQKRASNIENYLVEKLNLADDVSEEFDRLLLVMMADWLGDMQVFNRSEALKYGIPLEAVLACIMGSNFTKLGADGQPIKDENGKFLKGPNFEPPEDYIYATLFQADELREEFETRSQEMSLIGAIALPTLSDPVSAIFDAHEIEGEDDGDDTENGEAEDDEFHG